jgi:hypothetical protein
MSDNFDSLDVTEKTDTEAALNRSRALATKIGNERRNKSPSTSLTSRRWQKFATPLSSLPMSSPR